MDLTAVFPNFSLHFDVLAPCAISLGTLACALLLTWCLHFLAYKVLARLVSKRDLIWRSMVTRMRIPSLLAFLFLGFAIGATLAPLSEQSAALIRRAVLIGTIVLVGWFAISVLHIWTVIYLRRFKLDSEDNLLARKHVTQLRILQRIGVTLVGIITLSAALMTFEGVRQYGVSLLASAGAASIIVGLALQPMLKNMIAGVQLAITQPIRIEDSLLIENEWGNVEEITSTYVVVRLWDLRRLIVPLSYFIEKPFQNWTREGARLIGTVFINTDFTTPVAELRRHLEEIVGRSKLWDGRVLTLQVTDFKERTMEIRILVSASNAGKVFDLRCEVREQMISFIQQRYPKSLPRLRTEVTDRTAPRNY
jgi:small-conductance mechanosensitive channel